MDLSILAHGFVKIDIKISCPLPNKTKLKGAKDFRAYWSFCFELKVLKKSKYSMPWVRCAFGNVLLDGNNYSATNTVGAHPFNCWAVIPYSPFSTVLNFVISHFDILATGTTEEGAKDTRLRV